MEELFASDIKLAYSPEFNFVFENFHETEVSKLQRNILKCPSYYDCASWTMYHKNTSFLLSDVLAELNYATGDFVGKNSEPLVCRLEDGVVFS